jgi:hypothetical protein
MRENSIENYLIQETEVVGGRCLKWVCPQVNGVPDRIILLNGNVYFIELKRPEKSKWAALQIVFARWLVRHKFNYFLITSKYEVDRFIFEIAKDVKV